jgi:hypothetical protein
MNELLEGLAGVCQRAEPFDHPDWLFEVDGFRAAADTARGRLISRNGNRTHCLMTLGTGDYCGESSVVIGNQSSGR